jgi:hypothetical protein
MAATSIIPNGQAADVSEDIELTDGASATISLRNAGGVITDLCFATVQIKASDGTYVDIERLDRSKPAVQIFGPAIYRVAKSASNSVTFGVDRS